jgi:hypothetical protein
MQAYSGWFGVVELPFLLITVVFAFLTANELKGGVFGRGMFLIALGSLVMAVGHLHMQVEQFLHYNLFAAMFGVNAGAIIWFIALVTTWGLSGIGFYTIYRVSRAR